jgi:hypothetical protein
MPGRPCAWFCYTAPPMIQKTESEPLQSPTAGSSLWLGRVD